MGNYVEISVHAGDNYTYMLSYNELPTNVDSKKLTPYAEKTIKGDFAILDILKKIFNSCPRTYCLINLVGEEKWETKQNLLSLIEIERTGHNDQVNDRLFKGPFSKSLDEKDTARA